ncbi:Dehydrogenase [Nesidiocoris tenuis]|uniref:Dehydrogenase n=1 Tax=Nesidiocoris tenuis TaxID=355587 RepID=A0ABN7BF72_9HEMI|nr:Dehydrogenase [Nesidiocoris tenuis]
MDLYCKSALITGGASGIGLATADELLCNQLYRVILADCNCEEGKKSTEMLNDKYGENKACFVHLDVRKQEDFEEVFVQIAKKIGSIDILVNNAGFMDDNCWKEEINVNVKAVIRGTLLGLKHMQHNPPKDRVIVNVGSTLGLDACPPYLPFYTATQHAISGLTKSLGDKVHYMTSKIRVIGVCPGPTSTDLMVCRDEKALLPHWSKMVNKTFYPIMQCPKQVGRGIAYMVQYAPSGSLWVVEGDSVFKTEIPKSDKYRQTVIYV